MHTIGLILTWYGLGIITCAIAWGIQEWRAERTAKKILADIHFTVSKDVGHVVDFHPAMHEGTQYVHAHCICGETSLNYLPDDPQADSLMESWADNHVDTLMESSGR